MKFRSVSVLDIYPSSIFVGEFSSVPILYFMTGSREAECVENKIGDNVQSGHSDILNKIY